MRDATRTSCCVSRSGRAQPGSAGDIEDSAVPGTMIFVPSTIPFRQKGASMSTDLVDRIESSIDIRQGNLRPADFHHPCPARSDPAGFGNPDQLVLSAPPGADHRPVSLRGKRHTKKQGWGRGICLCTEQRHPAKLGRVDGSHLLFAATQGANPSD